METTTERILKQERLIVASGMAAITLLAWGWLLTGAGTGMSPFQMTTWVFPPPIHAQMAANWSTSYFAVMFAMWWIMMIAMMTPSASPMILLYARAYRYEQELGRLGSAVTPTFAFALGYLLAWMVFSLAATGLQWALEEVGLVHAMLMWSIDPLFTSALLIAAGAYQLTPLKSVCLEQCRSPAQFLAENFEPGIIGAVRIGMKHGVFCLGCCWFLMALLFASGLMNLVWVAGLSVYVLIEKIAPFGDWIARITGMVLIAAGFLLIVRMYVA